jgi:hypothetical protein
MAAIKGMSAGEFVCPVFGTMHRIPFYRTESRFRIIPYRGYDYYCQTIYDSTLKDIFYVFGIYYEGKNGKDAVLCPIVRMSVDYKSIIKYNIDGSIESSTLIL